MILSSFPLIGSADYPTQPCSQGGEGGASCFNMVTVHKYGATYFSSTFLVCYWGIAILPRSLSFHILMSS